MTTCQIDRRRSNSTISPTNTASIPSAITLRTHDLHRLASEPAVRTEPVRPTARAVHRLLPLHLVALHAPAVTPSVRRLVRQPVRVSRITPARLAQSLLLLRTQPTHLLATRAVEELRVAAAADRPLPPLAARPHAVLAAGLLPARPLIVPTVETEDGLVVRVGTLERHHVHHAVGTDDPSATTTDDCLQGSFR